MKRIIALVLVLTTLLAAAACAESSVFTLDEMKLSVVERGKSRNIRFNGMQINMAVGSSSGRPSLQLDLSNDEGSQLGVVVQLVDNDVLISVGSITGVFYYDMTRMPSGEKVAGLLSMALGSTFSLGTLSLAGLMSMITEEGKNGTRVAEINVKTESFVAAMDDALTKAQGLDAAAEIDFEEMRQSLHDLEDTVTLSFAFRPDNGEFSLGMEQEKLGMELSGVAKLENVDFAFADIDLDAPRIDVTSLTNEDIQVLNDEFTLMAARLINYADAAGLSQYLPTN